MTADMSADPKGRTIRRRSNAGLIADYLRRAIVQGEMAEGSALPPLDQLRKQFGVGLPAVREAIRILESEGLVTVVQGNTGGAIVHAPSLAGAASRLGMVLQNQRVELGDLAGALRAIEPVCAQLCAEQRDDTAVDVLTGLIEEARSATDEEQTAIMLNRRFHETLAERCGNQTLRALVGALEFLWSGQEQHWGRNLPSRYSMENRLAGIPSS